MLDCHTVVYDCQGLGQEQAITPFENLQKINNEGMVKMCPRHFYCDHALAKRKSLKSV